MIAFFVLVKTAESQVDHELSNGNISNIHFDNGVAFEGDRAMFIDFEKLDDSELNLSDDGPKKNSDEILKNSIIDYSGDGILHVFDSKKSDRYAQILDTERLFTYKIKDEKTYIYNNAGERSLLKILFIKNLKAPENTDYPNFPCMVLYLECKWFQGNYEIQCE